MKRNNFWSCVSLSVCELFAWQPPSETYPSTLLLQKVIELVDDGNKMRFTHIQGRISFRWIWNMFHFSVPENKIMICCFKKRYVSKLCFRKSFRILFNMSPNFIRFVKKPAILHVHVLFHKKMQRYLAQASRA